MLGGQNVHRALGAGILVVVHAITVLDAPAGSSSVPDERS